MSSAFAIVQWQDGTEETHYGGAATPTPHLASILVEDGAYQSWPELEDAVSRAFQICLQLQIPIYSHFRRIHVYDASGETENDWALSDLAFYLLLLNGSSGNLRVAQAQAWAIRKAFKQSGS